MARSRKLSEADQPPVTSQDRARARSKAARGDPPASTQWHLGQTAAELTLGEFQHALICLNEAFYRYIGRSLAQITGDSRLGGEDAVILNVIHGARPKTITDVQHSTNRSDIANVQYSFRKLERSGLIERAPRGEGRGTSYRLTREGRAITDRYASTRRDLFGKVLGGRPELLERLSVTKELLVLLTGVYDQASRELLTRS